MLDAILLGKTRSVVMREMFLNPDRSVSFNEPARRVKSDDGVVARELKILNGAGRVVEQRGDAGRWFGSPEKTSLALPAFKKHPGRSSKPEHVYLSQHNSLLRRATRPMSGRD
jgi:hypothetical protein